MTGIGRPQLRRAEFYVVAAAVLFVAVLALSSIAIGSGDVIARLASLSPQLVAGLLALSLVNYAMRTLRWHLFGRRLGIAVPFGRTILVYVAGFAMTPTPGKLGEALRERFGTNRGDPRCVRRHRCSVRHTVENGNGAAR